MGSLTLRQRLRGGYELREAGKKSHSGKLALRGPFAGEVGRSQELRLDGPTLLIS